MTLARIGQFLGIATTCTLVFGVVIFAIFQALGEYYTDLKRDVTEWKESGRKDWFPSWNPKLERVLSVVNFVLGGISLISGGLFILGCIAILFGLSAAVVINRHLPFLELFPAVNSIGTYLSLVVLVVALSAYNHYQIKLKDQEGLKKYKLKAVTANDLKKLRRNCFMADAFIKIGVLGCMIGAAFMVMIPT